MIRIIATTYQGLIQKFHMVNLSKVFTTESPKCLSHLPKQVTSSPVVPVIFAGTYPGQFWYRCTGMGAQIIEQNLFFILLLMTLNTSSLKSDIRKWKAFCLYCSNKPSNRGKGNFFYFHAPKWRFICSKQVCPKKPWILHWFECTL